MSDAAAVAPRTYDVGGFRLPRPFHVQRLGHFGLNCDALTESLDFYRTTLGFRLSDTIDYRDHTPDPAVLDGLGDSKGYFLRYGGDHHALVLFNRAVRSALDTMGRFKPGVTINQITWQVNSLEEVVRAVEFLEDQGVRLSRSGRDTPGSNWHTYFFDPDGHTIELYYGIEQIGWDGRSKPKAMYGRGFQAPPPLPQISESVEVEDFRSAGVDFNAGFAEAVAAAPTHAVGGILMPRPFVVTGIGPVRIFVQDVEASLDFYTRIMGLTVTARDRVLDCDVAFLRAGSEHHSLALYSLDLRAKLPVRQDTTSLSFGVRVASYSQLRAAVAALTAAGCVQVDLPPELSPGLRYAAVFRDPDGHLVQLYSEMEQLGWDGRGREPPLVPTAKSADWPETVEPLADSFAGEPFLGPWL